MHFETRIKKLTSKDSNSKITPYARALIDIVEYEHQASFESFWKCLSLRDVNVPSYVGKMSRDMFTISPCVKDCQSRYTTYIHKGGDICKSILIHGVNVTKVEIEINKTRVWSKSYNDECNPIEITPFEYGIILVNLGVSEIKIHVDCNDIIYCHYVGLLIPSKDRKRLCNNYALPYLYYDQDSGKLYNKILYTDGIIKLCEDTDVSLTDNGSLVPTQFRRSSEDCNLTQHCHISDENTKTSRSWWSFF